MSKICKKCDTLITFGDNNYCELCANILVADLEAKLAESEESCILLEGLRKSEAEKKDIAMKRVSELKHQLAEKDKAIENWQTMYQSVMQSSHNGIEEDKRLREQLKEKEKEIEKLTEELDDKNFCKDFVDLYTENKLKTQMLHENWKDKISFAVEQLDKVKDTANDIYGEYSASVITNYIDNQIKQLKEMK